MKSQLDPLYAIFEKHLYNFIIEEQSSDDLVQAVVNDYLETLMQNASVPIKVAEFVEKDLKEEVLEMLRKKTYGHYDLAHFRQTKVLKSPRRPS